MQPVPRFPLCAPFACYSTVRLPGRCWRRVMASVSEVRKSALRRSRELAQRPDLDVHFLVRDASASRAVCVDGMTVHFESASRHAGTSAFAWWSGARRFSDRLTGSLTKRLSGVPERHRRVECMAYDVLCAFGVTNRTASLVRSAHHTGSRVIVFLTSDRTLSDIQLGGRRQRGAYGELGFLCRYALRHADAIVVQKRSQQNALHASLALSPRLIRNPIDLQSAPCGSDPAELPQVPYVLWIGRADTFSKRADRCWQLARLCPSVHFVAIVNRHDRVVFEQLRNSARECDFDSFRSTAAYRELLSSCRAAD